VYRKAVSTNSKRAAVHHHPFFPFFYADHVGSKRVANLWAKEIVSEKQRSTIRSAASDLDVGALGLDVARLLALVANLLAGARLLGAVARKMTGNAAVVALVAVHAVACKRLDMARGRMERRRLTRHVANAAARVAGLLAEATTAAVAAGVEAAAIGRTLGAVASDVADLTAL
jgi:hypothetical protein